MVDFLLAEADGRAFDVDEGRAAARAEGRSVLGDASASGERWLIAEGGRWDGRAAAAMQ